MAKFKVGDMIVMNKLANDHYAITKTGSVGIIKGVYRDTCNVFFTSFVIHGKKIKRKSESFVVETRCMSLYEPTEDDGKTEVERKINAMFKRQPYYGKQVMV